MEVVVAIEVPPPQERLIGAFVLASNLHYAGTPAKFQQASGRGAARCAPVRHVCVPIRFLDSRRESTKTLGAGDGARNASSAGPSSTIRPAYITATRSASGSYVIAELRGFSGWGADSILRGNGEPVPRGIRWQDRRARAALAKLPRTARMILRRRSMR